MQVFGLIFLNMFLVFIMYSFLRSVMGWNGTQNLSFTWGLLFGGCYVSSSSLNYFSNNAMGSSYLTLPASHFEKWLCAVCVTWILYLAIFLLFYYGMDRLFVGYYQRHLNPQGRDFKWLSESVQPMDLSGRLAVKTYVMFGLLSSSMFVGALYFNKLSFIKTGLLIFVVLLGIYELNLGLAYLSFPNVSEAFPFSHVAISFAPPAPAPDVMEVMFKENGEAGIDLPEKYQKWFTIGVQYVLSFVLCICALVRLREKEF